MIKKLFSAHTGLTAGNALHSPCGSLPAGNRSDNAAARGKGEDNGLSQARAKPSSPTCNRLIGYNADGYTVHVVLGKRLHGVALVRYTHARDVNATVADKYPFHGFGPLGRQAFVNRRCTCACVGITSNLHNCIVMIV